MQRDAHLFELGLHPLLGLLHRAEDVLVVGIEAARRPMMPHRALVVAVLQVGLPEAQERRRVDRDRQRGARRKTLRIDHLELADLPLVEEDLAGVEIARVRLQADLLHRAVVVHHAEDEARARVELRVERVTERDRHGARGMDDVANALPVVEPAHRLEHQRRDVERHRHHRSHRHFLDEAEVALRPGEDLVDALFGLHAQHAVDVALGDGAHLDQDPAQQHLLRRLALHALGELLLGDESVGDQEMPEVLLGIGRGRGNDHAVAEEDPLFDLAVVEDQSTGLLALRQPLQQLGELHRLDVASDAHRVGRIIAAGPRTDRPNFRCAPRAERRTPVRRAR